MTLIALKPNRDADLDLGQHIEGFIRFRQVKGNTADTYRSQLKTFVDNCHNPLQAPYIHHWIEMLKQEGYSPLTIKSMVETVKNFLLYLNNHDIAPNKAHSQVIFKYDYQGGNHKLISKEKFYEMLEQCDLTTFIGLRDYALLRLYQSTGMRLSEPLSCKIGDIEVIDTFSTDGEYTPIKIPVLKYIQKGNRLAYVPLFPKTYDAIMTYIKRRADGDNKNSPLFASHSKKSKKEMPTTSNSIQKAMRKRLNAVGLVDREYSIHSFRYGQGTDVLLLTGDERKAQNQLGHLSPKTIQFYTAEIRAKKRAEVMLNLEY